MSRVAEPGRFAVARSVAPRRRPCRVGEPAADRPDLALEPDVPAHLGEEPRRDPRRVLDRLLRHAAAQQRRAPATAASRTARGTAAARSAPRSAGRTASTRTPRRARRSSGSTRRPSGRRRAGRGAAGQVVERRRPRRVLGERPGARLLQPAQRLVQRRPERPVDRHHLAGRLHLAAEACDRRVGNLSNGKRGSLTTT